MIKSFGAKHWNILGALDLEFNLPVRTYLSDMDFDFVPNADRVSDIQVVDPPTAVFRCVVMHGLILLLPSGERGAADGRTLSPKIASTLCLHRSPVATSLLAGEQ